MSLNKRSLKRDALPEQPLEEKLKNLEKHIKTRRGANRRAAFDALTTADAERAIAVVQELAKLATGKNQAELGGLLASTGLQHLVDAAARGKYGDVPVWQYAPQKALAAVVDALPARMATMNASEVERRARALGLVPRETPAGPSVDRALLALVDDTRLSLPLRKQAALAVLPSAPAAVWARRDSGLVPDDVVIAAGLATRYLSIDAVDVDLFERALHEMEPADRAARVKAAQLPKSAERFPPGVQIRLLAVVLDTPGLDDERRAAAQMAARMKTPEADEAILARPLVHVPSTVAVCERINPSEAHAVLSPLVRKSEDARDALLASHMASYAEFLDDAVNVLATDPVGGMALLVRVRTPRARQEILRVFETVDIDAAPPLLVGFASRVLLPASRSSAASLTPEQALDFVTGAAAERALVLEVLAALRPRAGRYSPAVDRAIRAVDT